MSASTWSGTVGDKRVALFGTYLVDGTTATIDGGTFESVTSDRAVFLVVNGGQLTITNVKISKTGNATTSDGAITAGSASSSIAVVTANGGTATGPTSVGAPSPGGR